jgi:transposase
LRLILSAGQCHDSPQAKALIEGYLAQVLMGDKGYDDTKLIEAVEAKGMQAVIPPRANRKQQRDDDKHLYKERHLVECFINKIKHYRRVFRTARRTISDSISWAILRTISLEGSLLLSSRLCRLDRHRTSKARDPAMMSKASNVLKTPT